MIFVACRWWHWCLVVSKMLLVQLVDDALLQVIQRSEKLLEIAPFILIPRPAPAHQRIPVTWTVVWSVKSLIVLELLVDIAYIDSWVGLHAKRANFPKQNSKAPDIALYREAVVRNCLWRCPLDWELAAFFGRVNLVHLDKSRKSKIGDFDRQRLICLTMTGRRIVLT